MHWFSYDGQYFFNLWNKDRVGRHETLFILFVMAIKITGSAQKYRVGRVSGNTAIFLFGLTWDKSIYMYIVFSDVWQPNQLIFARVYYYLIMIARLRVRISPGTRCWHLVLVWIRITSQHDCKIVVWDVNTNPEQNYPIKAAGHEVWIIQTYKLTAVTLSYQLSIYECYSLQIRPKKYLCFR